MLGHCSGHLPDAAKGSSLEKNCENWTDPPQNEVALVDRIKHNPLSSFHPIKCD
jgi:hypothetical protein